MPPIIRKQTGERNGFPQRAWLLYGDPKTGKTTTAAQFPKRLILNVISENGTTELVGDIADIKTPQSLSEICQWLKNDPNHQGYEYAVLDGITSFVNDATTASGKTNPRDAARYATNVLKPVLHEFFSLPIGKVITGHARRDTTEINVNGKSVQKISVYLDLPERLRLFVLGRVDSIGFCYTNGGGSSVRWLPYDYEGLEKPCRKIEAGNRLKLPATTQLDFAEIAKALTNKGEKP